MSLDQGTGFSGAWIHGASEIPINPESYSSLGLVLWLDAAQITGLSDNDPVVTWEDQSPSGNDATGTGTYKTNVFGDEPAVLFNGTTNFFQLSSPIATTTNAPFTVIVVSQKSVTAENRIIGLVGSILPIARYQNPPGILLQTGSNRSSDAFTSGATDIVCWTIRRQANLGFEFEENNLDRGNYTSSADESWTFDKLGADNSGTAPWNGHICEVLFYTSYLDDANHTGLYENYLKPKWGLP
jgi:hypothetical protein